jgi:hypothetical protein
MKYKKIRHLELLKQSQDLKKQGKSLHDENRKDYLELLFYKVLVQDYIYWENRHNYLSVMDNFINGIIDAEDFSDEFFLISNQNQAVHEAFETDFEPNPISKGFSSFIGCEAFEPEAEEGEEYNEKWLKDSVKDASL